ncbi:pilus assembly FimT family protein [Paludibacterium yongneupense]|uniref:pilus assembly FimT family protein n=1 Tax=Paludibacterium yongneupense TaxID=400061 RepID=UPI0004136FBF|nr:GspH/FimT family pseudopilin [Paludibacterium yongneupense]
MPAFSLVEVLAVLAMVALLLVSGLPPLLVQWDGARLEATLTGLSGSILFARGEAMRLRQIVQVCAANISRRRELVTCRERPGGGGFHWSGAVVYFNADGEDMHYHGGSALRLKLFDPAVTVLSDVSPLRLYPDGHVARKALFILHSRYRCASLSVDGNGRATACRGERCTGCR